MQEITDGKTRSPSTGAMIQARKLTVAFDLKARYNITKGCVVEVSRPVQGRTRIERDPIPKDAESKSTDYQDFQAGDNCLYVGLAFDHWSGKTFMEFVGTTSTLFYDYDQHGAGDQSIGEIFTVVVKSGQKQAVI